MTVVDDVRKLKLMTLPHGERGVELHWGLPPYPYVSRSLHRKRGLKLNDPTALWLVHTMRWDLLFFQQFLDSALHSKFHERQTFRAMDNTKFSAMCYGRDEALGFHFAVLK